MPQTNILVIEDDEIVARTVERCLRGNEFSVTVANSGVEGLQVARRHPPHIAILDVIMPGMDGYTVCREMRSDPLLKDVPILFLTAKTKDEDKITGFKAGADDYLSKPFNIDELILRIRAILRRSVSNRTGSETEIADPVDIPVGIVKTTPFVASEKPGKPAKDIERKVAIRGYVLDTRTYELSTPSNKKIRLTPVQFDLLYHLMSHAGEIFSPSRLLDEVWDYPTDSGSPDLVRVHIKNLRERIEEDSHAPVFIETIPGYGYTIQPDRE
jgi:DNA-binding response OmpR family regulator